MTRMSDTNGRKRAKEKVGLKPIFGWFYMVYFWTFRVYQPFYDWKLKSKHQSVIVSYFYCGQPTAVWRVCSNKTAVLVGVSLVYKITKRKIPNPKSKSVWLNYVGWCQFISSIWTENTIPIKNSLLWWSTKDFISKVL